MSITLIIGNAMTDYYLANELLEKFPTITIVRYDHTKIKNLKYYFKKLNRFGFFKSFGIKLLSIFLRLEIIFEKITKKDIWTRLKINKPNLSKDLKIENCKTLDELHNLTSDSKLIILTQTIRLPDKFFKPNKKIIQIIGGKYPNYCGDSAVFWATALQKESDYCFSIILRHRFFEKSTIIKYCPISIDKGDSIRIMRAKGIIKISYELLNIVSNYLKFNHIENFKTTESLTVLTTPTLYDYIKVVLLKNKLKKMPKYATSSK